MIREINPKMLFFFGWSIWFICYGLIPVTYVKIQPLFPALGIFIGYNLAFLVGLYCIKNKKSSLAEKIVYRKRIIQKLFIFTFILGFLGVMLRIYQRGGIDFTMNVTEARVDSLKKGEGSGGILSIFAAILYPFSFISLMLVCYFRHFFKKYIFFVAILMGLYPLLDSILLGSRSVLFFQGIALFIMIQLRLIVYPSKFIREKIKYLFLRFKKFRFFLFRKNWVNTKSILRLSLVFLFSTTFFIQIQKSRNSNYGDEFSWSQAINFIEQGSLMHYDEETKQELIRGDNRLTRLAQLGVLHYIVHGTFEYIRWVNYIENYWGTYYGKYQFYVFVKFFKMVGVDTGKDFMRMTGEAGRVGIFTTFWGPVYLDFGIFGIAYAFILGLLIKTIYNRAIARRNLLGLLMYPLLGAIVFSMPIINAIVGQNMYYFPAIIITYLLFKLLNLKKFTTHVA